MKHRNYPNYLPISSICEVFIYLKNYQECTQFEEPPTPYPPQPNPEPEPEPNPEPEPQPSKPQPEQTQI
jgi:hypothetical protein